MPAGLLFSVHVNFVMRYINTVVCGIGFTPLMTFLLVAYKRKAMTDNETYCGAKKFEY
jgi:hypothetical protein